MSIKLPSIFQYSNFRLFLADYQKALSETDKEYNRSNICKKLGLPNSRSYFNDVVSMGKKVTPTYIDRFVKAFQFDPEEAKFFRVLVKFNQSENIEERELNFEQLISLNKTPKTILDKKAFSFFGKWHHSVIRAVLDVVDFNDDYKSLAKLIFPPLSEKTVKESIDLLKDLDLIQMDESGYWRPSAKAITTSEYIRDEMVVQYQIQGLELAKQALIKMHKFPQNISTNTISVSKEGYKRIHKKIDKFRSEIRSLASKDEQKSDCVYQMNIQLFPAMMLTKKAGNV